jgi:HEPN superfamily RiboL-PSP-like protein
LKEKVITLWKKQTDSSSKSHPNVANYVNKQIKAITNLTETRVRQLLGSFSKDWVELFEESISGEQKAAMDSIVANRHLIVHGRSVEITYVRVGGYYKHIKEVITIINDKCTSF